MIMRQIECRQKHKYLNMQPMGNKHGRWLQRNTGRTCTARQMV